MPESYELCDCRFLTEQLGGAGIDGLVTPIGPVPENKVWTVLSANCYPSVNETQIFWFAVRGRSGNYVAVSVPVSIALTVDRGLPMLTQGMEIKLFPGEYLSAFRAAATVGSNFYIRARYVISDLPYYAYEEPLKKVVRVSRKHAEVFYSGGGGTLIGEASTPAGHPPTRGGKGESEPI